MKNIFVLIICALFTFSCEAQIKMGSSPQTVTNTGTALVVSKVGGGANSVSIQGVVTKVSGTIAGKQYLSGSLDGVNYVLVDSLTLSDVATNHKIYVLSSAPYLYYKISVTGSGTMVGTLNGYILANPDAKSSFSGAFPLKSVYSLALDTVTNAGTKTLKSPILSQNYQTVSVDVTITKTSGTIAGTVTLQGSIDGTNFSTVLTAFVETPASQAPYTVTGAATYTATNVATQTKIFTLNGNRYNYYRISYAGSGTMVGTIKGNLFVSN